MKDPKLVNPGTVNYKLGFQLGSFKIRMSSQLQLLGHPSLLSVGQQQAPLAIEFKTDQLTGFVNKEGERSDAAAVGRKRKNARSNNNSNVQKDAKKQKLDDKKTSSGKDKVNEVCKFKA